MSPPRTGIHHWCSGEVDGQNDVGDGGEDAEELVVEVADIAPDEDVQISEVRFTNCFNLIYLIQFQPVYSLLLYNKSAKYVYIDFISHIY